MSWDDKWRDEKTIGKWLMASEPLPVSRTTPVPRDSRFPHLAPALDPARMRRELQQVWVGTRDGVGSIESCEIQETLYRPGKSCLVVYRIGLGSGASGARRPQLACVRLCAPGTATAEHREAAARPLVTVEGLPSLVYLPSLEALVWTFPNDPRLVGLPAMFDVDALRPTLTERLALPGLTRHGLREIETDVMHYRPAETCMVRYRLTVAGRPHPLIVYGKIHSGGDMVAMHRLMVQLAQQQAHGLRTARPLGHDTPCRILWQSHVTGTPVNLRDVDPDELGPVLTAIGRCVGAFHRTTVDTPRRFEVADVLTRLDRTATLTAKAWLAAAERVRSVVEHLEALAAKALFTETFRTPVHRDLKPGNFLWDGRTVGLIDTSGVRLGDPLSDVGSLIASLSSKAIQLGWDEAAVEQLAGDVVDAYASTVPWPVRGPRLDWHIAAALVYESTLRSVRQWDPEKLEGIPRYLALAERHVQACAAPRASRSRPASTTG